MVRRAGHSGGGERSEKGRLPILGALNGDRSKRAIPDADVSECRHGSSGRATAHERNHKIMFLPKTSLPRRSFLRGLGATFTLPLLDAMIPAFAATAQAIPRLGFMYIPNGVNLAQWTPSGSGTDFALSPTLS